ncbi:hypothetical protein HIM_04207 [Hirsutella minnesotensis 3608]|uniref:CFEM domain-containing protein n=1 Tax=Hirsutella minnesotensis 3608 TaxID=1043627 RepID=A0A0F7ZVE6_9HYPO|nr:hypothetical protein HIM_04207 [Hirsutella minnesotensis 3608]
MRTSNGALGFLALGSLVNGGALESCKSELSLYPACALPCINTAAVDQGCRSDDLACRCEPQNRKDIEERARTCVTKCSFADVVKSLHAGKRVCRCVRDALKPTPPMQAAASVQSSSAPHKDVFQRSMIPQVVAKRAGECGKESPCQKDAEAVPDCAKPCIESAAISAAKCANKFDFECQCSSSAIIQKHAFGCVTSECGLFKGAQVLWSVSALCACASANPTTPCATQTSAIVPSEPTPTTPSETTAESTSSTTPSVPSQTTTAGPSRTTPVTPSRTTQADVSQTSSPVTSQASSAESRPATTPVLSPTDSSVSLESPSSEPTQGSSQLSSESSSAESSKDGSSIKPSQSISASSLTSHVESSELPSTETPSQPSEVTTSPILPVPCSTVTSAACGAVATSAVPHCAQSCFSSFVPKIGCDVSDYACQCQPEAQKSLTQLLVPCVATACPPAAIPSVIAGASRVCECATASPTGDICGTTTTQEPAPVLTRTETRVATVTSCETDTLETSLSQPSAGPSTVSKPLEEPVASSSAAPQHSCNGRLGCNGKAVSSGQSESPKPSGGSSHGGHVKQSETLGLPSEKTAAPRPIESKPTVQTPCHHPDCHAQPSGHHVGSTTEPAESRPSHSEATCDGSTHCRGQSSEGKKPDVASGKENHEKPSSLGDNPTQASRPVGGETAPPEPVAGSAGRYEITRTAFVFSLFWAIAVAL